MASTSAAFTYLEGFLSDYYYSQKDEGSKKRYKQKLSLFQGGDCHAKFGPPPNTSGRTEIGSQNRSALLLSVRPGALELNKNLNYRGFVDSNPVVDIDTDKDVLLLLFFYWVLLLKF